MTYQKIKSKIITNPKILFLVDGIGALISAFSLGIVLVSFESIFKIPPRTLYFLASFPVMFALYDFYCCLIVCNAITPYLKGIALLNLFYCCLSLGAIFYHLEIISTWGLTYLLVEITMVTVLAIIEISIAKEVA